MKKQDWINIYRTYDAGHLINILKVTLVNGWMDDKEMGPSVRQETEGILQVLTNQGVINEVR